MSKTEEVPNFDLIAMLAHIAEDWKPRIGRGISARNTGEVSFDISPRGDILISHEGQTLPLPDDQDGKIRKIIEQASCQFNFHYVMPCGCRYGADLKAKKQPSTKRHRRLHGGRWNKLRRNGSDSFPYSKKSAMPSGDKSAELIGEFYSDNSQIGIMK